MVLYKRSIIFLILFIGAYPLNGNSQNITGDSIFININLTFDLILPTNPTSFSTIPDNTSYKVKSEGNDVTVTTDKENLPPATLIVSEGGRKHNFIIFYKKDIDLSAPNSAIKDYSTTKKLQERVNELSLQKSASEEKNKTAISQSKINNTTTTEPTNKNELPVKKENDSSSYYYSLLEQGDNYLKLKDDENAQVLFGKAHALRPDDVIPLQRLDEIKARKNNDKYLRIITEARTYKQQKNYTLAQEAYKQALDIKAGDASSIKELAEINAFLKQDSVQKETQRLNELYKHYLAEGESAFNKNQLTEARAAYSQALNIRHNDVIAIARIKLIDAKEKQQKDNEQLDNNYIASIGLADKLFNSEDYDNSRVAYKKALGFIEKDYPKKQISIIDKIIAERLNQEKADKQKLAKDEEDAKRYATLIKNAAAEFDKANFSNAKKIYSDAYSLKPAEEYPKNQMGIIDSILIKKAAGLKAKNDSITMANETNKKYNQALKQGKAFSTKHDLLKAKDSYEEAMNLKPLEKEPEKQLQIINSALADIARKKETDSSYNSKISIADSLSKVKSYGSALKAYSEAQDLKPTELYPKQQIKAMQFQLAEIERINENNKRIEKERNYNEAISNANKNYSNKKNYDAKSEFLKAQSIHPLNNTDQQRFNNLLYQIDSYQKDSLSKISVNNNPPKKSKRKKSSRNKDKNNSSFKDWLKPLGHGFDLQGSSLSYTNQELKIKYLNITIKLLSSNQFFNKPAVSHKESFLFYNA